MNVFVTGGTGFVGAHLVATLRGRGDTVTCLVRRPALAAELGWTDDVRLVRGGLDDAAALREAAAGADVVYHVAGKIAAKNAADFMATNRDGTANVLEAAADAGAKRFVLVSSLAAAGPTIPGHPIDETRPPAPVTDYGRSKLAAEVLVRAAAIPWTIVRPPVVYGEWDRGTVKIFQLAKRGVAPVFGDGSQELSVIHAEDLARSLVAAGTTPAAAGRVYFAAHVTTTTSRGLVLAAGRALGDGRRRVRVIPVPPLVARGVLWTVGALAHLAGRATLLSADKANEFLAPAWTCRSDALTRDTGWRAEIGLDAGLRRAADWYREVGWI